MSLCRRFNDAFSWCSKSMCHVVVPSTHSLLQENIDFVCWLHYIHLMCYLDSTQKPCGLFINLPWIFFHCNFECIDFTCNSTVCFFLFLLCTWLRWVMHLRHALEIFVQICISPKNHDKVWSGSEVRGEATLTRLLTVHLDVHQFTKTVDLSSFNTCWGLVVQYIPECVVWAASILYLWCQEQVQSGWDSHLLDLTAAGHQDSQRPGGCVWTPGAAAKLLRSFGLETRRRWRAAAATSWRCTSCSAGRKTLRFGFMCSSLAKQKVCKSDQHIIYRSGICSPLWCRRCLTVSTSPLPRAETRIKSGPSTDVFVKAPMQKKNNKHLNQRTLILLKLSLRTKTLPESDEKGGRLFPLRGRQLETWARRSEVQRDEDSSSSETLRL